MVLHICLNEKLGGGVLEMFVEPMERSASEAVKSGGCKLYKQALHVVLLLCRLLLIEGRNLLTNYNSIC